MAIKFSQFNLRTDHTEGMYLVGYDGNQNIHITVDNLFDDFINGTENTIAMFGTDGIVLADSILSQDAGATILTVAGQLNVDAAATFDTSITVTGDSTLNGNVTLGDASTDLITQTGTLYLNGPVKDTTDTLGAADQVLLSDAAGELTFTDLADLHVGGAEVVEVPVKNMQGSALVKGDPVYISGSVGASGRLEVQLADASNTLKMPAVGLLKQDLADNAEGFAVVTGKLRNLITDPIDGVNPTENDVIYVKPSGTPGAALTTTKPVYGNFIQNIGKVGRVSTSNDGNLVVSSILRTNDIPNLTPGRLWIGSTGNTIESQTLFVDEANGRLGINEASPGYSLDVDGTLQTSGWVYFATSGPSSLAQVGGASTTTSQFNIISTATGGSFIAATNTLTLKTNNVSAIKIDNAAAVQFNQYGVGVYTGTAARNLSVDSSGNVIETAAVPANIVETFTNTSGTFVSFGTDNTSAIGDVTVGTIDLSATGTPDATKYLRGDNTWATITGVYDWDISDGVNLPDTIGNGETVTFSGDTYITTTYAAATNTLSIDHDDTTRADTTSSDSPAFGGTFEAVTSVTTNTTGHVTAIDVSTVTLPTPVNYSWAITADTGTSQTVLNGNTVDIAGGTYISTVVGATDTVTINHDATTRTDTTSSDTPGYGGTFTVVDSVSTNATGHLEAINVKTVTMPSADDTNTTYDLSGYGTSNGTSGVQLVGSDATTDQVAITGAGTTTVAHSGNTITVTSNDQYTGTVDGSGTANYVTKWFDTDTITDSVIYDDGTNIGIGTANPARLFHIDSGTTTAWVRLQGGGGFGRYTDMYNNDDDFLLRADASNTGTSNGAINFAVGLTDGVSIGSSGQVTFWQYGSGAFTGTAAKNLAVDSSGNVIETDGSIIDGSGTANYVSKWSDANTLTDSIIYDDGTDVGIGTATPNSKLQVDGSVQVADDTDTASADKVGALRYRTISTNSYVDMCMQTGATTYEWVNIVQNNW